MSEILVLSADDVRKALPMKEAIEAMKTGFAQLARGEAVLPVRTVIPTPAGGGTALLMPAFMSEGKQMGVKLLTLMPENPARGIPLINAVMAVFDGETGIPIAILNGGAMTAIRTGAASGAATDLIAPRDASTAVVFGSGIQGRTQLEAVCAVRKIRQAWVYDPDTAAAGTFAEEMSAELKIDIAVASTTAEALVAADIVCTATTSSVPIFSDDELRSGVHINAVGAFTPETREIPPETVIRSYVVIDEMAAAMDEAGDILQPMAEGLIDKSHIRAEIGEIAAGLKPPRDEPGQTTLFKSVGIAVQDIAAAAVIIRNAEKMGLGAKVEL